MASVDIAAGRLAKVVISCWQLQGSLAQGWQLLSALTAVVETAVPGTIHTARSRHPPYAVASLLSVRPLR